MSTSLILQSILGGVASDFAIVEMKDRIFKFSIFSHEVRLLIYNSGTITDASFKVSFHLWNERGLSLAESFVSASLGMQFHWIKVCTKKNKCSLWVLVIILLPDHRFLDN